MFEKAICRKCKYFYITWDKNFPNGCRAYAIKTKHLPSAVVFRSTGKGCACYAPKS